MEHIKIKASLKVGDLVIIDGEIFQIYLKSGANGVYAWETPNLIKFRKQAKARKRVDFIKDIIKDVDLKKEDIPLNEDKIVFKDILRNSKRRFQK